MSEPISAEFVFVFILLLIVICGPTGFGLMSIGERTESEPLRFTGALFALMFAMGLLILVLLGIGGLARLLVGQ